MRNKSKKCEIDNNKYDKGCDRIVNKRVIKMRNISSKCEISPKAFANKVNILLNCCRAI